MGKRLHCTYKDINEDNTYDIEIYDGQFSGSSTEFDVRYPSGQPEYKYEPNDARGRPWIITTQYVFTMIVANATHEAFYDDLLNSDENRFHIIVKRNASIDYIGLFSVKVSQLELKNYPVDLTLTAVDSLSLTKNIPYYEAQSQNYISQFQEGKFYATITAANPPIQIETSLGTANGSTDLILPATVENQGGHYDILTGKFEHPGKYKMSVFLSMVAAFNDDDGQTILNVSVYKIDAVDTYTELHNSQVTFDEPGGQRRTVNFDFDVELGTGDKLTLRYSWGVISTTDDVFLQTEPVSYWSSEIAAAIKVDVIHETILNHCKNLLQRLPTYDLYTGADEFFAINITYTEANQTSERSEEYIGIPYNAFVKNMGKTPPEVLTVYDALAEIAKITNTTLIYRQGVYFFQNMKEAPNRNSYDKDFAFLAANAGSFSESPMTCRGTATRGALPAIGEVKVAFNRIGSYNILYGVAAQIDPDNTSKVITKPIKLTDESLYLTFNIRMNGEPVGSTNYDLLKHSIIDHIPHRHVFECTIKLGSTYLKIDDQTTVLFYTPATYLYPSWQGTANVVKLYSDPITDPSVQYDYNITFPPLPKLTYTGDVEFSFKYLHSLTWNGTVILTDFNYDLRSVILRKFEDDEDKVYTQKITASVANRNNSEIIDLDIIASDLTETDEDPGSIKVYLSSAWTTPGLFGGVSLQMRIAQDIAARQERPNKLFSGAFTEINPLWGNCEYDSVKYLLLRGSYKTYDNILRGDWSQYITAGVSGRLEQNIYTSERGDSRQSESLNTATPNSAPINTVNPNTEAPQNVKFEDWEPADHSNNDYVEVTIEDLIDLTTYDISEARRKYLLKRNGIDMRFVTSSPANESEVSIDISGTNNRLTFWKNLRSTDILELRIYP